MTLLRRYRYANVIRNDARDARSPLASPLGRRLANAALSPLASPLLPKGEATTKAEDSVTLR
ncbi:hypothetical protein LC608_01020 [Nostoc sp. XA010]|uniref:hypothetical protein n=1 Tax=Nostoc sp. XA010 TaxID=2780407 RepID=UPI001E50594F|nr:hypothetical protein [Nostoc sp. XA010]MCC5655594.1 hypothetical protein [Nostoc sp. XA010]